MGYSVTPDRASQFQPCQIVCLEHETMHLYAEVVQIVEVRRLCWVRPLLLLHSNAEASAEANAEGLLDWHDLRNGSDLLLPIALFRSAFDTEVVPLLSRLYCSNRDTLEKGDRAASGQLNGFIQQLWRSNPAAFAQKTQVD